MPVGSSFTTVSETMACLFPLMALSYRLRRWMLISIQQASANETPRPSTVASKMLTN